MKARSPATSNKRIHEFQKAFPDDIAEEIYRKIQKAVSKKPKRKKK